MKKNITGVGSDDSGGCLVDIWPNGFFLCLLFQRSKSGQGTNNRRPWIFLSFSLFLHLMNNSVLSLSPYMGVRGPFRLPSHVWFVGGMTLLGPGSFWGVASGTQHWATWSNGYWRIFKPTKSLRPKSKNYDNGRINM